MPGARINAFSVLDIETARVRATVHHFDGTSFEAVRRWCFSKIGRRWQQAVDPASEAMRHASEAAH